MAQNCTVDKESMEWCKKRCSSRGHEQQSGHYTCCAALDLAPYGIRVNSVNPGPVKTDALENNGKVPSDTGEKAWDSCRDLTAVGKVGEAEEIADLIAFLASDKARSITGSIYVSDNGVMLKWKNNPELVSN